ncbi:phage integrase [Halospina denitrificans]|uniref:phage integrase n=1 Tax=Halospina denitrificans TaxID=332522 RepID=UPI003C7E8291
MGQTGTSCSKDKRRLSELFTLWYDAHRRYLKDGKRRYDHSMRIAEAWGDPVAADIQARDYMKYRAVRTEEGRTPKTCNNELGYLNAVFNELQRLGEINYSNPLSSVRPLKVPEQEMGNWNTTRSRSCFRNLARAATTRMFTWLLV